MKKFYVIIFSVLTFFGFYLSSKILEPSLKMAQGTMNSFYDQPDNSLDVFFVGSCHAYSSFKPMDVWDQTGITSHLLSSPAQDLQMSYYYLKEGFKTQRPKVVFLELFSVNRNGSYIKSADFDSQAYLSFYSMKFSIDKIKAAFDYEFVDDPFNFLVSFFRSHSRWDSLTDEDYAYINSGNLIEKGWDEFANHGVLNTIPREDKFNPLRYSYDNNYADMDYLYDYDEYDEVTEIDLVSRDYLLRITDLVKQNNAELVFVIAPFSMEYRDVSRLNNAKKIAEEKGIAVIDFNAVELIDEIGLTYEDMVDYEHVNKNGAAKISTYISEYLQTHYEIQNTKNDWLLNRWKEDFSKRVTD